MNDFRLEVFIAVARNLSFTKAADILHISQPAISKHIQELENIYNAQLFYRKNNTITLTEQGTIFLDYALQISEIYRKLKLEIDLKNENLNGELKIGASTTIAQYILPEIIAKFMNKFKDVHISMLTGNSHDIESALSNHNIDIGMIEGYRRKRDFHYDLFAKDELVLITSVKTMIEDQISIEKFKEVPLVLRESGSGTLEVIEKKLSDHNIKLSDLNIILQLGSTEGIKQFLHNSCSFAIVSIAAVIKELINNEFKIIDIDKITIERDFSFITTLGSQNKIADKFHEFAKLAHNQKL